MRLIDADALIEQMEEDMEHMEEPLAKMFTGAAISDIKHAPTIEPERKTGRWIQIYAWSNVCKCSECGGRRIMSSFDKYCSYCGADMKGEQNGRLS